MPFVPTKSKPARKNRKPRADWTYLIPIGDGDLMVIRVRLASRTHSGMLWSQLVREVKRIQRVQRPGQRPALYNFDPLHKDGKRNAELAFDGNPDCYPSFRLYTQWGDRLVERTR